MVVAYFLLIEKEISYGIVFDKKITRWNINSVIYIGMKLPFVFYESIIRVVIVPKRQERSKNEKEN